MSNVIIKGELHSSSGDHEEERELVKDGIDVLVIEGQQSESEYGLTEGWYKISMWLFNLFLFQNVYISKQSLIDLAEVQGAEVIYTRESDDEMLANAPIWIKILAAIVFYALVSISLVIGLISGDIIAGASVLFLGALLPILLIRYYNMRALSGDKNRDQIMADKIATAAEGDKTVLAIIGNGHVDNVKNKLPNEIDPEIYRAVYGARSLPHIREMIVPVFTFLSTLFVFYFVLLRIAFFFLG